MFNEVSSVYTGTYMGTMSHGSEGIGQCPNCEVTLSTAQILIEYDRGGRESVFADCRRCGDVVHPI